MTDADYGRFTEIMTGLCETFGRKVSEGLLGGYWMGLSDLPLPTVEAAITKAVVTAKYMPVPFEIRQQAGDVSMDVRVAVAWKTLLRAIREVGVYGSWTTDDAALLAVVDHLGGWTYLTGLSKEELEKWVRKDFERLYRMCCESPRMRAGNAALGLHSKRNAYLGYPSMEPKMIPTGLPPLPGADGLPMLEEERAERLLEAGDQGAGR